MSNKLTSALVAGVVSLVVALLAGLSGGQENLTAGGTVENFPSHFSNGLYAGTTDQFSIDSSGNITTSGTFTGSSGDTRIKLVQTGDVTTIASGSVHLTAAQICDSSLIKQNVTGAGVTASNSVTVFPTSDELLADCLTTVGDSKTLVFENTSNDATEKFTLTATTGIDLQVASRSSAAIQTGQTAIVRFTRLTASSVSTQIVEFSDGD